MKNGMEVIMPSLEVTKSLVAGEYVVNPNLDYNTWYGGIKKKIHMFMFSRLKKARYLEERTETVKAMSTKKVVFQISDIDKMLMEYEHVMMRIYHKQVGTLIVGPTQLQLIADTMVSVRIPDDTISNIMVMGERLQLRGIEVIVLPWFDGVLPVPRFNRGF